MSASRRRASRHCDDRPLPGRRQRPASFPRAGRGGQRPNGSTDSCASRALPHRRTTTRSPGLISRPRPTWFVTRSNVPLARASVPLARSGGRADRVKLRRGAASRGPGTARGSSQALLRWRVPRNRPKPATTASAVESHPNVTPNLIAKASPRSRSRFTSTPKGTSPYFRWHPPVTPLSHQAGFLPAQQNCCRHR